jgi:hypothetical protein
MVHIVLILAACFAIGSAGFFLAIILGPASSGRAATVPAQQLSSAEKNQIVNNLSTSVGSSSVSAASASSSSQGSQETSPQQADQNDTNASAELKILQSLNGSQ